MSNRLLTTRLALKLKSTQGFMLAEQLVSIIFIGLLCLAISAGLAAAMTVFANVTKVTESQALLNRSVQEISDELAFSTGAVEGTSFVSKSVNARVWLVPAANNAGIAFQGDGILSGNPKDKNQQVLLVPSSGGLVPVVEGLRFEKDPGNAEDKGRWFFTIRILQGSSTASEVATSGEMTIARVGN
ncbi:MAG: hypothetical protein RR218_03550 [Gordonibacter sp.]